jgi:antitoxin HicB
MQYAYPCNLMPDYEEGEGFIVTFPDVPGAITGARTREESLFLAEDALVAMLAVYVQQQREIPTPSPVADGQELVAVPPIAAAKLALYTAMREQGTTPR